MPTASAKQVTEIATPEKPVRYHASTWTGPAFSRWGRGSHTAPICHQPGRSESAMRRATTVALGVVVAEREIEAGVMHGRDGPGHERGSDRHQKRARDDKTR